MTPPHPYLKENYSPKATKKKTNKQTKKTNTGRWTCQVEEGRPGIFFFFSFLVANMTLKTQQFLLKSDTFGRKFWENILTYFQKISAKTFRFWSKDGWFYMILDK